jgi:hypothetical protein
LDLDYEDSTATAFIESGTEPLYDLGKFALEFLRSGNWSLNFTTEVAKVLGTLPMENIHVRSIRKPSFISDNVQSLVVEMERQSIGGIYSKIWLRKGKSQEETRHLVLEYQKRLDGLAAKGVIFSKPLRTILARREGEFLRAML